MHQRGTGEAGHERSGLVTTSATLTRQKALAASFFDRVWNQKDLDYHHEILSPDFRLVALWQNTSMGRSGEADREVSLDTISRWIQGFPDLRISIEEQLSDGQFVASRHRFWGTHSNDFMGYQATGIPVTISGNTIMKISGDKVVGAWSCWDAASWLTQIGVFPAVPDAHRLDDVAVQAWCSDSRTSGVDPDRAKALLRRVYRELWGDGTLDVADELIAPGFIGHTTAHPLVRGPGGVRELVKGWRCGLSGLGFSVDAQHVEGGAVATSFTMRGTHTGMFAGRAPTGAEVTMTGIAIAHVVNGQIATDWTEIDMARLFLAIGASRKGNR
jgi:predicted ester cyclase